ncbi:hydrophobic/amphiphilic exporter-1, HAE1 family [Plantibacter sp. VKM Ac-1784]|uniref:Hydrophobic/amphiphilic exporter-1, HAE1 family n=1 Tax=Plantibacter elymi (nom. nud.) TaxID=199708 RepID=A0ABY1R7C8_9MICO|nr:efflux RND transporter permease subunit [Plantibacter sp. VKM Ac-1784]SMQ58656.1 hydrophobic/amphiphilic exporter-1, HAE1 family [Plantibacter sp. VKM Ac-1784]
MSFLTRLSLANRLIVGLITAAIVAFGLFAVGSLKQELLPSVQQPGAVVAATYPGASPSSVEREVTKPVEQAVQGVKGVTGVTSTSVSGSTSVQVSWDFGQDDEKIVGDIRSALAGLKSTLPNDTTTEVYAGGSDDIPVLQLAVASEDESGEFAGRVETTVLPALRGIAGVRQVDLAGENATQLVITMRPADLAAKKVTAEEVMAAVQASGVITAAGTSVDAGKELSIEVGSPVGSLAEVQALPIQHEDGPFALSAVADVELVPAAETSIARADGLPSLSLTILKDPSANAVQLAHTIRDALPGLEQELGSGAAFTVVFDQSPMVEQSIHDLSVEGGLGLLFAIIVILVFLLSIRSTIITAVSIPLSLLIAMIGLWIGDYSLNIFTLAALTVAVGRVVDDSIVVIENIKRRHTGRVMTTSSVVEAVHEVAGAVTASTITTVAVFLPVAFVGGTVGELFRPFAVTVSVALIASLVVSLTIVPVLAYWFMRGSSAPAMGKATDDAATEEASVVEDESEAYSKLQRAYLPVLRTALKRPVVTLLVAAVVFAGTIVSAGFLKTDYLGDIGGENTVTVTQELPEGTSLDVTSDAAAAVEAVLAKTAGVSGYLTTVGGNGSSNTAQISVTVGEESSREGVADTIRDAVAKLDDVGEVTVGDAAGGFTGGGGGMEVTLQGEDPVALATAAAAVQDMLGGTDGLRDATSDLADEQGLLKVNVDRAAAARYGFTQEQVGQAIAGALRGAPMGSVILEGASRDIIVRSQRVGTTPAEIAALPLPVSALQQAAAQKAATDALTAEQDEATQRAKDEAASQAATQRSELQEARSTAASQLDALRAQLSALQAAPVEVPPVTPTTPEEEAARQAYEARAAQLAGLSDAISQLQGSITTIDEQLTAMRDAESEAAEQQAEADRLTQAQKDLANVSAVPIPVSAVAQVGEERAAAAITRIDGVRTVTVSATPTGDDLSATTLAVREGLAGLDLPSGVTASVGGVAQDQEESFAQLGLAMLIAIVLVFIVMVATFRSLLQPLILLVSVPFAATGAIAALLITGTPLGIPSMIGLLMLIGIVVTNAIVLIDLVNSYRARGDGIDDAVLHGARLRLRPIIMTACATIFALVPMSLGLTGGGVFISQSLAIVVIGGLVSSTLLTLILVPVLYLLLERRTERRLEKRERKRTAKAARHEAEEHEEQTDEDLDAILTTDR